MQKALDIPMGNSVHFSQVAFRVWAPNADSVDLVHEEASAPMERRDDGTWTVSIDGGPGLEYLYRIVNGDESFDRLDPYARQATNSVGRSIVHDPDFDWDGVEFHTPTIDSMAVYEMHPGTFAGDLDQAIERLPHLVDTGFTAVELMPVAEFAGDQSWGYNPALPFAVESAYGGPEALKRFVREAHRAGLAVILDVVYNHFGPSDLDLWRFDGWYEGSGGGIYLYNDHRAETPWGHTRPDYGRPEVRAYIIDNARMWFDEYRLDGLRLDSTINIRTVGGAEGSEEIPDGWSIMQALAELRDAEFAGRVLIAEDLQRSEWLTKSVGEGGAGFDAQWDAEFVHTVRASLETPTDHGRNVEALATAVRGPDHRDGWGRVVYTESHDEVANGRTRVVSEIDFEDPEAWYAVGRAMCGMVLTLTARGVPMFFQGQEWLETDYFDDSEPVDWDQADARRPGTDQIARLIRLRGGRDDGATGLRGSGISFETVDNDTDVVAYRRWRDGGVGDEVLVVLNVGHDHRTVAFSAPTEGAWTQAVSTDVASKSESIDDGGIAAELGGYSAMVFVAT